MSTPQINWNQELGQQPAAPPTGQPKIDWGSELSAPATAPTGTLRARPDHPVRNWLEDAQEDIHHGTTLTLPGKVLHALGATGLDTGVSEGASQAMQAMSPLGLVTGPLEAAHGGIEAADPESTRSQQVRGANELLGGVGKTVGGALPFAAPAHLGQVVPTLATYGPIQHGVEKGAEAAGVDPDSAQLIGNMGALMTPVGKGMIGGAGEVLSKNARPIARTAGAIEGIRELSHGRPPYGFLAASHPGEALIKGAGDLAEGIGKTPLLPHEVMKPPSAPIEEPQGEVLPPEQKALPRGAIIPPEPAPAPDEPGQLVDAQAISTRGQGGKFTRQYLTGADQTEGKAVPAAKQGQAWQAPDLGPKAPPRVINGQLVDRPQFDVETGTSDEHPGSIEPTTNNEHQQFMSEWRGKNQPTPNRNHPLVDTNGLTPQTPATDPMGQSLESHGFYLDRTEEDGRRLYEDAQGRIAVVSPKGTFLLKGPDDPNHYTGSSPEELNSQLAQPLTNGQESGNMNIDMPENPSRRSFLKKGIGAAAGAAAPKSGIVGKTLTAISGGDPAENMANLGRKIGDTMYGAPETYDQFIDDYDDNSVQGAARAIASMYENHIDNLVDMGVNDSGYTDSLNALKKAAPMIKQAFSIAGLDPTHVDAGIAEVEPEAMEAAEADYQAKYGTPRTFTPREETEVAKPAAAEAEEAGGNQLVKTLGAKAAKSVLTPETESETGTVKEDPDQIPADPLRLDKNTYQKHKNVLSPKETEEFNDILGNSWPDGEKEFELNKYNSHAQFFNKPDKMDKAFIFNWSGGEIGTTTGDEISIFNISRKDADRLSWVEDQINGGYNPPIKTFDPNNLKSIQTYMDPEKIKEHLDNEGDHSPVTVYHINGHDVVVDGNHRVEAAKQTGRQVTAKYYDYDKLKSHSKTLTPTQLEEGEPFEEK